MEITVARRSHLVLLIKTLIYIAYNFIIRGIFRIRRVYLLFLFYIFCFLSAFLVLRLHVE
jgi:hypothetical protein